MRYAERRENDGSLSYAGCSNRFSSEAAAEESTGGVASGYVEDFVELRTQVTGFFSSLT